MQQNYQQLFNQIKTPQMPESLFEKVMRRIKREHELMTIKRKLIVFSVCLIGSAVIFVPVFKMAQASFIESEFLDFFSLLFSDSGTVMSLWKEFLFLLAESFPLFETIITLSAIFAFLALLKAIIKNISTYKLLIH